MKTRPLTLLSWGYWGWGTSTEVLVRTFDAVEASRGFGPPLFVDVRLKRAVRAPGFNGGAFGRLLGERYRWLPGLGNARIATGRGPMRLQDPDDVSKLLGSAVEAAGQNRRVVFFCSCPSPNNARSCHRWLVGTHALRAARPLGLSIQVQEWPGGALSARVSGRLQLEADLLDRLRANCALPLHFSDTPRWLPGLPTGTVVELRSAGQRQLVSLSPPVPSKEGWRVEAFVTPVEVEDGVRTLVKAASRYRRHWGLEARTT